ncbi:MAG: Na+/H+ antiporter NhaC family protein [Crocinitomicaceae bacterium]|nr:Na+/H+ antiporter NhaC family protein [Crocinitomicaceae bacterium]
MHKILLFGIVFLVTQLVYGQTAIHFPSVVLSGVETDFEVESEDQLSSIVINQKEIPLKHLEGTTYTGKIQLTSANIDVEEGIIINELIVIPGWLSILPPLIAILLALLFKEVISALFIGIFIGAATLGFYNDGVMGIFGAFLTVLDHYILDALVNPDHLSVILFSVLIGSVVAVISKNGGMQGVVNKLVRFAKTRKSGMLTTYFLGIAIFFDDYANTLVVGNTMRSVTDKLRISREKLAYIVDSTAAPIAAVAFITTWIGAELTYISGGVEKIQAMGGTINESAYSIFVNSLAYSFYPIFTLFFMFFLLYKGRDFSSMYHAEKKALEEGVEASLKSSVDVDEFNPVPGAKIRSFNAIIPILFIVFGTFIGLIYTGLQTTYGQLLDLGVAVENGTWNSMHLLPEAPESFFRKLGTIIGNANSYTALLWASLSGLTVALFLTISQRIMKLEKSMETVVFGVKTMIPAVMILVLAWSLAGVTEDLHTAEYLKSFFDKDFSNAWIIPGITFILSAFIAFSTGSSWSTMALMYPLVIPLMYSVAGDIDQVQIMELLYNTIASVLAGSVLGDHCSPISDTTILSSLATSCDHISHVRTQMPYALTVGLVALLFGVIPGALGVSSLITIPLGIAVLYLIVHFVGKKV